MNIVKEETETTYTVEINQPELDILVAMLCKTVGAPLDLPNVCLEEMWRTLQSHTSDWELVVQCAAGTITVAEREIG